MSQSLPLEKQTVSILQTYGKHTIINAQIVSTPVLIHNIPTPAIHVYLILDLIDVKLIVEKNNRVEISYYAKRHSEQITPIRIVPCLLSTFIHNGILSYQDPALPPGEGLNRFWSMYHLEHNNCQQFVFQLLKANQWQTEHLEKYNQSAEKVKQHINDRTVELAEKNNYHPLAQMASKLITNTFMDAIAKFSTDIVQQQHKKLPDSELITMDAIHFHSYPGCTQLQACQYEEEWYKTISTLTKL